MPLGREIYVLRLENGQPVWLYYYIHYHFPRISRNDFKCWCIAGLPSRRVQSVFNIFMDIIIICYYRSSGDNARAVYNII